MSAFGGKADMPFCGCKCLLMTQSGPGRAIQGIFMGSRSMITLARERLLNLGVAGTIYLITKCAAKGYTVNLMVCHLGNVS